MASMTVMGAGTYDYVDTGVIGTDAIKVAFIYKPATVSLVGDYAVLDDPSFTDPLPTTNRRTARRWPRPSWTTPPVVSLPWL